MTAMDESMAKMGMTAAKYLREYLVVYLYGAHELLRMKADTTGLYYEPPPVPRSQYNGPLFPASALLIASLGWARTSCR